jgi:acetyltransferase-like isoleucine patch superfamily enzyme
VRAGLLPADVEPLVMGHGSYGTPRVLTYHPERDGRATVGAWCSIAEGVTFVLGGEHRTDWVSTYPFRVRFGLPGAWHDGHPASRGDIVVGNDVWIGRDAVVLAGVEIGDGAVVAGNSVVTRDVRPYAIVAGNPAREVRRRFSDEQVEALLRIRWWDWPHARVLSEVTALCDADIDGFIARFDRHPAPA